jgi:hypothetical protein
MADVIEVFVQKRFGGLRHREVLNASNVREEATRTQVIVSVPDAMRWRRHMCRWPPNGMSRRSTSVRSSAVVAETHQAGASATMPSRTSSPSIAVRLPDTPSTVMVTKWWPPSLSGTSRP